MDSKAVLFYLQDNIQGLCRPSLACDLFLSIKQTHYKKPTGLVFSAADLDLGFESQHRQNKLEMVNEQKRVEAYPDGAIHIIKIRMVKNQISLFE